jgi:hypothetical protein
MGIRSASAFLASLAIMVAIRWSGRRIGARQLGQLSLPALALKYLE